MTLENATIPLISPLTETTRGFLLRFSYTIGGLFGLTVIMFIYKIFLFRKFKKLFEKMNSDLEYIKKKIDDREDNTQHLKSK